MLWRIAKSTAQEVLSNAFCYDGKNCWWFVSLNKMGFGTPVCCFEEVCGDKYVQEYTMYVLKNPSVCVCERELEGALSVFCSFSQIPNTKLSLLNCQDGIIAGKVQCFSPAHVRLNDTRFGKILQLYQGFQVQVFNYKSK